MSSSTSETHAVCPFCKGQPKMGRVENSWTVDGNTVKVFQEGLACSQCKKPLLNLTEMGSAERAGARALASLHRTGATFRHCRRALGLSCTELIAIIGGDERTVAAYENNAIVVDGAFWTRMSALLQLSLDLQMTKHITNVNG